jgi:mannose-1-phosphate guanylyltransferase
MGIAASNSMNEMIVGGNGRASLRCGIVLAGGEGQRLRSFVQSAWGTTLPKQYISFVGTRSMLEHTFHRAEKLIRPERLFTVISGDHLKYAEVQRQLASRPRSTIVVQPQNKETAPGLLLPLIHLYKHYPYSTVAVFPSDHFIQEESRFMLYVHLAFRLVEKDPSKMILLGVEPSGPEPEYGYILPGQQIADSYALGVREISGFIEKPTPNSARTIIGNGGLWNTMVMIFSSAYLLNRIREIAAAFYASFQRIEEAMGKAQFPDVVRDVYKGLTPTNFSRSVLEVLSAKHSSGLAVLPLRGVHWSDWGSKQRILATLGQIEDGRQTNAMRLELSRAARAANEAVN